MKGSFVDVCGFSPRQQFVVHCTFVSYAVILLLFPRLTHVGLVERILGVVNLAN